MWIWHRKWNLVLYFRSALFFRAYVFMLVAQARSPIRSIHVLCIMVYNGWVLSYYSLWPLLHWVFVTSQHYLNDRYNSFGKRKLFIFNHHASMYLYCMRYMWLVNMLVILFMAFVLPSLAGRAIFSWVSACRIEALSKSVTPWNMLWCVRSLSISVEGITQDQICSNLQTQMLINFIPKEVHWKFMWLLPFFSLFTLC